MSLTRTVSNGVSQKAVTVSSPAGTTITIAAAATSSAVPVWALFSYGANKLLQVSAASTFASAAEQNAAMVCDPAAAPALRSTWAVADLPSSPLNFPAMLATVMAITIAPDNATVVPKPPPTAASVSTRPTVPEIDSKAGSKELAPPAHPGPTQDTSQDASPAESTLPQPSACDFAFSTAPDPVRRVT